MNLDELTLRAGVVGWTLVAIAFGCSYVAITCDVLAWLDALVTPKRRPRR